MEFLQIIVVVTCVMAISNAAPVENVDNVVPLEIANCINRLTPLVNTTDPKKVPGLGTPEDVYVYCLQQFLWRSDMVRWEDYNITKKDKDFVNGLIDSNGQYDMFASLHDGVSNSAHNGPNFLGWHRVYLALLEEAMRNIDNTVSLPYWDSSLDNEMANPANTIVFSKEFFGNGDGEVITGPFANWDTHHGPLTRNIAGEGQLFSKENITTVLTRCNTAEITRPTALQPCDFERYHGGPHNWVGGQMMGLTTSSHDPVFFLHHAFVDYIWEKFRYGQLLCKPPVDPEVYPPADGLHAETNPMDGFPRYINIDGYRNYWTQNWYKYEDSPRCPICGSKYLKCDKVKRWCVPIERKLTRKEGYIVNGTFMTDAADTAISESAAEARAAVEKLDIGKKFDAPDDDYRTQRAQLARMAVGPNGRSGPRGKRTF